jgi:hypothetical protein
MFRRSWLTALLVLPLAACFETDLTIRPDGAVAGTITWDSADPMPEAGARALFKAEGITVKRVEAPAKAAADAKPADGATAKSDAKTSARHRITVEVEATSVETLATAPLFRGLFVTASLGKVENGKRTLAVSVAKPKDPSKVPATDNVITLRFPGPVAETSGVAKGNDVTWTVPAADYKQKPSVDLKVVYAAEPAAPAAGK